MGFERKDRSAVKHSDTAFSTLNGLMCWLKRRGLTYPRASSDDEVEEVDKDDWVDKDVEKVQEGDSRAHNEETVAVAHPE